MIGTNPLSFERDEFCFMWWETGKCSKSSERIWMFKFDRDGKIIGKWDRDWIEDMEPVEDLMSFVKNSYLVLYQGKDLAFLKINEALASHFCEPLDSRYLIDVEEFLSWIDDEKLVQKILNRLHDICLFPLELEDKADLLREWFISHLYPIFKYGVN